MPDQPSILQKSWSLPRRRTFLACNGCKAKKSKCDGGRPSCARCVTLHQECGYSMNERDKRLSHHYANRRAERSMELTRRKASAPNSAVPMASRPGIRGGAQDGMDQSAPNAAFSMGGREKGHGNDPGGRISSNAPLRESLADELATNAFDQAPHGEVGYFGSSTNHGFFWCLLSSIAKLGYRERHALAHQARTAPPTIQRKSDYSSRQPPAEQPNARGKDRQPSEEELMTRFFDTVACHLPYVDEEALIARLGVLRDNSQNPSTQAWQALLNIVLAYSAYTLDGHSPKPYYQRAINLLYGTAIHLSTLQTLQALMLLSSFEQNNRRSMASLSSHALAVRTAYHLGIHASSTYRNLGARDRHLRARLWLGLVNQDRILGALLGRPCLVPASNVRDEITSMLATGATLVSDGRRLDTGQASGHFALLTSLHEITGMTLEGIYLSNIGSVRDLGMETLLSKVMELSMKLDAWKMSNTSLPISDNEVGHGHNMQASEDAERLAMSLSLHYHLTCLLVHGSVLMRSLEWLSPTASDLPAGIAGDTIASLLQSGLVTVRNTHQIICKVLRERERFLELNALWWICNYSAFTASLHLFALWILSGHLTDPRSANLQLQKPEIELLLQAALQNLKQLGSVSMLSSKAYLRLQALYTFISNKDCRGPPSSFQHPGLEACDDGGGQLPIPDDENWITQQLEILEPGLFCFELPSFEESGAGDEYALLHQQDMLGQHLF